MCKMTRQHYQFIADTIGTLPVMTRQEVWAVALHFSMALKRNDAHYDGTFDDERFRAACIPNEGHCDEDNEEYNEQKDTYNGMAMKDLIKDVFEMDERGMNDSEIASHFDIMPIVVDFIRQQGIDRGVDKYDGVPADTGTHE